MKTINKRLVATGAALVFAFSLSGCNSGLPESCTQALRAAEEVLQSGEKMAIAHSSADRERYVGAVQDLEGRGKVMRERAAACKAGK
jgi:hypothetical protein